jgi:hypothetical protein
MGQQKLYMVMEIDLLEVLGMESNKVKGKYTMEMEPTLRGDLVMTDPMDMDSCVLIQRPYIKETIKME